MSREGGCSFLSLTFVIIVIFIFGCAESLLQGGGSLVCGTWA